MQRNNQIEQTPRSKATRSYKQRPIHVLWEGEEQWRDVIVTLPRTVTGNEERRLVAATCGIER